MKSTLRAVTAAAISLALSGALAACGDDDSDDGAAKPERLSVQVVQEGKNKWRLTVPKSVKAGLVEVSLKSPSGKSSHTAQLVRVEGDHSEKDVVKILTQEEGKIPEWLRGAGGVGQTKGGQTGAATQALEPGKYYALDDGEVEGEEGETFAKQGAIASFEVTGDAESADLPEADGRITAKDYTFAVEGLKAGRNTIEFENTGKELHHVIAFPYRGGATLDKVKRAFKEEKGEPPVDFENTASTAVLDGGAKQTTTLDLKPGKYALVCFIPDRKGGPPHIEKGMIVEATVD